MFDPITCLIETQQIYSFDLRKECRDGIGEK